MHLSGFRSPARLKRGFVSDSVGWHWEFAPSFLAELVPGLVLVPFWTLAIVNVYRKWKQTERMGSVIDVVPLK